MENKDDLDEIKAILAGIAKVAQRNAQEEAAHKQTHPYIPVPIPQPTRTDPSLKDRLDIARNVFYIGAGIVVFIVWLVRGNSDGVATASDVKQLRIDHNALAKDFYDYKLKVAEGPSSRRTQPQSQ